MNQNPKPYTPSDQPGANTPETPVGIPVQWNPPGRPPYVSYVLLGITAVFYLAQMASESLLGADWLAFYGMKINSLIMAGEVWRLITPIFLHGSITHIAFNLYALYIFGPGLETHYGHKRFLLLYLLAGFAGNATSFFMTPGPSLGASTALFGLIAAEAVFIYKNRILFGLRTRPMLFQILFVVVLNFMLGLTPNSNIDNWGHLGGMLGGLVFAWTAGPVWQMQRKETYLTMVNQVTRKQVIIASAVILVLFTSAILIKRFFL
ncbi:MAG: rhomboid family intramembrane serine protease [Anaerolineaceae bacterium]|nr:rhomboid family intramembrane serine protease [Anaerolineaceae bacterium]NTV35737.1 rhomboid family intramembrane serine protease [Anaerolineaceae bacterium]